jgi:hypothetical protein
MGRAPSRVRYGDLNGGYHISSDAFLRRRRLGDDISATQEKWKRSLLNFVRWTDTIKY